MTSAPVQPDPALDVAGRFAIAFPGHDATIGSLLTDDAVLRSPITDPGRAPSTGVALPLRPLASVIGGGEQLALPAVRRGVRSAQSSPLAVDRFGHRRPGEGRGTTAGGRGREVTAEPHCQAAPFSAGDPTVGAGVQRRSA